MPSNSHRFNWKLFKYSFLSLLFPSLSTPSFPSMYIAGMLNTFQMPSLSRWRFWPCYCDLMCWMVPCNCKSSIISLKASIPAYSFSRNLFSFWNLSQESYRSCHLPRNTRILSLSLPVLPTANSLALAVCRLRFCGPLTIDTFEKVMPDLISNCASYRLFCGCKPDANCHEVDDGRILQDLRSYVPWILWLTNDSISEKVISYIEA